MSDDFPILSALDFKFEEKEDAGGLVMPKTVREAMQREAEAQRRHRELIDAFRAGMDLGAALASGKPRAPRPVLGMN